jgi:hypothetical protein
MAKNHNDGKNRLEMNGYVLIYKPEYHRAMKSSGYDGYVYEHIYIVEESLGRHLTKDEHVHHLDENRSNNRIDNLIVLSNKDHGKLHGYLNRLKSQYYTKQEPYEIYCLQCGRILERTQKKYCSNPCRDKTGHKRKVKDRPSYEQLLEEINSSNYCAVGRKYGVSDNAIRKWINSYEKELI